MGLIFFFEPGFDERKVKILLGLLSADEVLSTILDLYHGDAVLPILLLQFAGEELGCARFELADVLAHCAERVVVNELSDIQFVADGVEELVSL